MAVVVIVSKGGGWATLAHQYQKKLAQLSRFLAAVEPS